MTRTYSISDLAREFDVTPRAIRFYEDKGLLTPARRGQTRIYAPRDRARLILILRGKRFGFSLRDIKEMLDLYEKPDGGIEQLRVTLAKSRDRIAALKAQRDELEDAIAELEDGCGKIRERLAELGDTEEAAE
ncbi:MAG: MerR family DNA-binding transcriptional regulator [Alphaproteobacteria bacterium]|nr:MerR family DNA-binding transcriptional regulator [Alphaproteobacteria bacterium]MDX5368917.1 MerR family DNA-binding transcriptional regulator [Alphaproteobacteria bacterium]MDX5463641.1 MerR family DNA-binding transcriptional regulator [Alphaproteobacteria bacterium]